MNEYKTKTPRLPPELPRLTTIIFSMGSSVSGEIVRNPKVDPQKYWANNCPHLKCYILNTTIRSHYCTSSSIGNNNVLFLGVTTYPPPVDGVFRPEINREEKEREKKGAGNDKERVSLCWCFETHWKPSGLPRKRAVFIFVFLNLSFDPHDNHIPLYCGGE